MGRRSQPKPIEERAAKFARANASTSVSSINAEIASSSHWPGPFSTANQLIANRDAAREAREALLLQGSAENVSDEPADPYEEYLARISSHQPSRSIESLRQAHIPSLTSLCIHVLADHIESVDALDDLPEPLQAELALQLANRRKLNSRTVSFCISPESPVIKIPQCSDLHDDILPRLFASDVSVLELRNCGHCVHDQALSSVLPRLGSLKVLTLTGLYRLTDASLAQLLYNTPQLAQADFSYNSNLGLMSMTALAALPLTHLTLDGIAINDSHLKLLRQLQDLKYLSLCNITTITDGALKVVLSKIGGNFTHLSIAHCSQLTDITVNAIARHCKSLEYLNISHLRHVSTESLSELFSPPSDNGSTLGHIASLNIENLPITDDIMVLICQLYGSYLLHMNVSRTHITAKSIAAIIKHCHSLVTIDVSFIYALHTPLLNVFASLCPTLRDVKIWGNMQLDNYLMREK